MLEVTTLQHSFIAWTIFLVTWGVMIYSRITLSNTCLCECAYWANFTHTSLWERVSYALTNFVSFIAP